MTGARKCELIQLKRQGWVGIGGPRYLPGSTPHQPTHLGLARPACHVRDMEGWQHKIMALSSGIQLKGGCREPWRSPPRPQLRLAPGLRSQE